MQYRARGALGPHRSLGLALILAVGLFSSAQAAGVDLKSQMSAAEYRAAGLDRLTDSERAALEAWLAKHGARPFDDANAVADQAEPAPAAPEPPSVDRPSPKQAPTAAAFGDEQLEKKVTAAPEVITAQIAGSFRGWDGKTVFRLTNGQIWKQRVGGRYRYRAEDPEVQIERARFGYYLKIVATGRKVGVKRVK